MRLTPGSQARGLFVKLAAPQIIEMAARAGLDFVIIDLEHSPLTEGDALTLVRVADLVGLDALVRVPHVDPGLINRLIEEGAAGIQLSNVISVAQVKALVAATRFAPAGTRSVSTANRRAAFGQTNTVDYVTASRATPPLLVVQIESALTIDSPHDIAAAGADVVFIGSVDLTVSADFEDERVHELETIITDSARDAGILLGGMAATDDRFDYSVIGSDLGTLANALTSAAATASRRRVVSDV